MKRKIIVILISFAITAAFNGLMQASSPPPRQEQLSDLPFELHVNGAFIKYGKNNRVSSEMLPFTRWSKDTKQEDPKKGQADKAQ